MFGIYRNTFKTKGSFESVPIHSPGSLDVFGRTLGHLRSLTSADE